MSFSISLVINLKNSNFTFIENLIKDSAENCNVSSIYYDFELEGINKYIKKNNKIIILDFNEEINIINFLKFIINIKEINIEYIYYENSILYCSKKYLNSTSKSLHEKNILINNINKNNNKYKSIYNILNII